MNNAVRLHGEDTDRLKINKLPNGYTFATRKNVPVVDGNLRPDAVMIIARDWQGRLLVIRESRPVAGGYLWSVPAGMIDGDESPQDAAKREVKEETGLDLDTDDGIMYERTFSTPGMVDEIVAVVTGTVTGTITRDNLQHEEDINAFLMDPDDMSRAGLHKPQTPMSIWLALSII